VERGDRQALGTFYSRAPFASGSVVRLSEAAAHHARVKRLAPRDVVRLTNGAGEVATGVIASLDRSAVDVRVEAVEVIAAPPPIHLRVPLADRDRMLLLAEKATELGVTTWQAVRFRRSMSVSPRGEGGVFADKLRLRMIAALEQSAGAWLPRVLPDTTLDALDAGDTTLPIVLDMRGAPLPSVLAGRQNIAPLLLVGPEGGIEIDEREALMARGWTTARLAPSTLRFETAGIAAVAVARADRADSR
jgi:16S rRNA (uracil1498-N3)-methyltransferase